MKLFIGKTPKDLLGKTHQIWKNVSGVITSSGKAALLVNDANAEATLTKNGKSEDATNVVSEDLNSKWVALSNVTEKPVELEDIAVAVDSSTVTTYILSGLNATAVEIYCDGDASFTGLKVVLNAATSVDAFAEIDTTSGTSSFAEFIPPEKSIFLPLATSEDDTLRLTTVSLSAVGSAVNNIYMRFA